MASKQATKLKPARNYEKFGKVRGALSFRNKRSAKCYSFPFFFSQPFLSSRRNAGYFTGNLKIHIVRTRRTSTKRSFLAYNSIVTRDKKKKKKERNETKKKKTDTQETSGSWIHTCAALTHTTKRRLLLAAKRNRKRNWFTTERPLLRNRTPPLLAKITRPRPNSSSRYSRQTTHTQRGTPFPAYK